MILSVGDRLGPYLISARIGAGGMGEVYTARDTRLNRTVALKVLSPDLAGDAQFRERFSRETQAVAALNHPHICTVYDAGEATVNGGSSGPIQYLAMEYLEGETLASRLTRGPLPPAEALPVAVQLARALAKAHRADITHRDVKPANVMLTKGSAKLLDFGLAKYAPGLGGGDATSTGVVLGTVQYMAPEQLAGRPVDARTDIFAFGAVLYEMLTGNRSFQTAPVGTAADAGLIGIPNPALDRVVRKCLAIDPDDRWQSMSDLGAELEWIAHGSAPPEAPVAPERLRGVRVREAVAWSLAALLAVTLVATVYRLPSRVDTPVSPKGFVVRLPDLLSTMAGDHSVFAVLPDGSGIAYDAGSVNASRIHLYTLADGVSRAIPETEGAKDIAVSPDGRWLAYTRDKRLMKLAIAGGSPITICPVSYTRGISWGSDDWIVYGEDSGLKRVSAAGGSPETLTSAAPGEVRHVLPHVLPGGKAVAFTILMDTGTIEDAAIDIVSVSTRQRHRLVKGGADARFSPTGHLLYMDHANLMAVAFDADRLRVSGAPFLAGPTVRVKPQALKGFFDLSRDGTLVYLASGASESQRTLVWVDRHGLETPLPIPVRAYFHPALLPDDRSVIIEIEDTPHNLWHLDLTTGALTRLTHEGANHRPVASADGRFFVFSSDRTTPRSVFRLATDGSGAPEQLFRASVDQNVTAWSRDGRWLALVENATRTRDDILVLPLDGSGKPRPFLPTAFSESAATFSPDGRWIAYTSDESGRPEVMIAAFPGPGPRRPVSTGGGESAAFAADGKTLFYRSDNQVWAAALTTDPALSVGRPHLAFQLPTFPGNTGLPNWLIDSKGERVLAVKYLGEETSPRDVQVIVNWFESLRRAATASGR
jgi:serine/threonine protein kinase/Tol biopolymer transport system component